MNSTNSLKRALGENRPVVGIGLAIPSAEVAAALAASDFDFLWIEMEHSPITLETAREMILATRGLRAVPITRVPFNEPWIAKRVMDLGSFGVVFPASGTPDLVRQAVSSAKYPPAGVRGFGPFLAAPRWGLTPLEYVRVANEELMVIPMIEEKEGVDRIDEIVNIPGIDVLFIGANDLSFSYGQGGKVDHPSVQAGIDRIIRAATDKGIPVGHPAATAEDVLRLFKRGIKVFQVGNDLGLLKRGADDFFGKIRA